MFSKFFNDNFAFFFLYILRQPLGYGFVSFPDRNTAQDVLRQLNGKPIPNQPTTGGEEKRFFLKPSSRQPQTYSVFVGNLSPEIDGDILKQAFVSIYPSVSSARGLSLYCLCLNFLFQFLSFLSLQSSLLRVKANVMVL